MSDAIRIAIVDDHPIFRAGMFRILAKTTDIKIVAEGESADDALRIAEEQSPDIMLLDVSMPGDGLIAARDIRKLHPLVKVIMLTVSENEQDLSQALEYGASGYVLKGVLANDLLTTLALVHAGRSYVTPHFAARMLTRQVSKTSPDSPATAGEHLSNSEQEILRLVNVGRSNKEIARDFGLSERAIKGRLSRIMKKLKVRNRIEAVRAARYSKNSSEETA